MARLLSNLFVVIAVLASACSSFDSPSQIKDRRILAIRADKPQLIAKEVLPQSPPNPQLPIVSSIKLDALIVEPSSIAGAPSFSINYEWGYCLVAQSSAQFPGAGNNGLDAGNQKSIRCQQANYKRMSVGTYSGVMPLHFVMTIPQEIVAGLQGGGSAPLADLRIQLVVDDGQGGNLYAVKNISVSATESTANANPAMNALAIDGANSISQVDDSEQVILSRQYNVCDTSSRESVENSRGQKISVCSHTISPIIQADNMETYLERNALTGQIESRTEQYQFAWYSDLGSFAGSTTSQPDPRRNLLYSEGVGAIWREPTERPDVAKPFHIWVVIRDGRGGIDWETRTLYFMQ